MGEAGIVLVTEVSRLSRLSSDWHRVIELCAVFTLIADEDGIYDAQNPNDRLLTSFMFHYKSYQNQEFNGSEVGLIGWFLGLTHPLQLIQCSPRFRRERR